MKLSHNPSENLLNYALNSANGVYKKALTHIIVCQCAAAISDFDRVLSSLAKIKTLAPAEEECIRLIGDIEIITGDKEWTYSQYRQKNLLTKINRYFEYCFENVSLDITDGKFAEIYLEFIKSRLEMEFGFSYLAMARYYMALSRYDIVFSIIESVINKFPDSKYEYLAICDLLEIYKMEYQSLERNNEDFIPIVEKIVQMLLYILKTYSYQPRSFYTIIRFAYIVFRYERGVTSLSFYEKLSETYSEAIYEEEIKLEFVNYYIGRSKFKEALVYLNEYESIFNKTTRKNIINLYKLECYIQLKDSINAHNIYKALDEKSFNENNEALIKLYHLIGRFAALLEMANCLSDAISVYEKIYKSVPVKKLKEEALYKLITLNINYYFNNKEKMSDEIRNIVRGYCLSYIGKYPKSMKIDEIKLIYEGLNADNVAKKIKTSSSAVENAPGKSSAAARPAVEKRAIAEIKIDGPAADALQIRPSNDNKLLKSVSDVEKPFQVKPSVESAGAVLMKNAGPLSEKKMKTALQKSEKNNMPAGVSEGAASAAAVEIKPRENGEQPLDCAAAGNLKNTVDPFSSIEGRALKPESFDYVKAVLYLFIAISYIYVFFIHRDLSIAFFYSKLLMSYFPVLVLTGFILYEFFKKMKLFE